MSELVRPQNLRPIPPGDPTAFRDHPDWAMCDSPVDIPLSVEIASAYWNRQTRVFALALQARRLPGEEGPTPVLVLTLGQDWISDPSNLAAIPITIRQGFRDLRAAVPYLKADE